MHIKVNTQIIHHTRLKISNKLTAWCSQLKSPEADVIQSLIIQDHAFICILNKLVNRKGGIVRLNNCIWDLWWGEYWKREHHSVRILLPNLWYQQGTHARTSSSTQRVADLKSCRKKNKLVNPVIIKTKIWEERIMQFEQ